MGNFDTALVKADPALIRGLPFAQYQFVDVTFNSTAHADTDIRHNLTPVDPYAVRYAVASWSEDAITAASTTLATTTLNRCSAYATAAASLGAGDNPLALDAEDYDVGTMHDNAVNNSRITIPTTGFYAVRGKTRFAVSASGTVLSAYLIKNNATFLTLQTTSSAGGLEDSEVAINVDLTAGDYIQLGINQGSGGNLNIGSSNRFHASELQVTQLPTTLATSATTTIVNAPQLYTDTSATRKAWGQGYIVLRCSVPSVTARLLLFLER